MSMPRYSRSISFDNIRNILGDFFFIRRLISNRRYLVRSRLPEIFSFLLCVESVASIQLSPTLHLAFLLTCNNYIVGIEEAMLVSNCILCNEL